MALLQRSLNDARLLHNTHRIRPYPFQECPSGKPSMMYAIPEAYGMFSLNYYVVFASNKYIFSFFLRIIDIVIVLPEDGHVGKKIN